MSRRSEQLDALGRMFDQADALCINRWALAGAIVKLRADPVAGTRLPASASRPPGLRARALQLTGRCRVVGVSRA